MKMMPRLGTTLLVVLVLLAAATASPRAATAATTKTYACPRCGQPCDAKTFNAPGTCPDCGMPLVAVDAAAAQPAPDPNEKKVAVLVFGGAEILDFTGPYEMFGAAGFDVYTVAATRDPVTTAMGLTVVPKFTFADAPQPDVLVIPGGGVYAASRDEATLGYIKTATARATHTMSVCNGAFILANTGLLDGLTATTTYGNIPKLAKDYPKIKVVRDQRYVDNGKIITAAGLSAGIDGALHVIARLRGTGFAQKVALAEEVDWKPSGGFVRAALADRELPPVDLDDLGDWSLVRTEGDTKNWEIVAQGTSKLANDDLMGNLERQLAKGQWTKVSGSNASPDSRASTWRFTGSDGKLWKGTLKLDGGSGAGEKRTATLSVARAA